MLVDATHCEDRGAELRPEQRLALTQPIHRRLALHSRDAARVAPLLAAAACLACLAWGRVPIAAAGTYTVRACSGRGSDGWTEVLNDPIREMPGAMNAWTWTACPGDGSGDRGLYAQVGTFYWGPRGSRAGWRWSAPPATSIAAVEADITAQAANLDQAEPNWLSAAWSDDNGPWLALSAPARSTRQHVSATGLSVSRITLGLGCWYAACRPPFSAPGGGGAVAGFNNIVVTVRDDVAPEIDATPAPAGDWRRDLTYAMSFTATDNVGVKGLELRVDGRTLDSVDRDCYSPATNVTPRPCSGSVAPLGRTFDSDSLQDGAHELRLRATDVAGNTGERLSRILIDRRAPPVPRAVGLAGGDGWRVENRFDVGWVNPPEPDAAPIEIAEYELCPAANEPYDDSGCVRGERRGSDISRIGDLAVPSSGPWRVRISLRDAAGNGDPDRAATVEGLRLDTDRPLATFLPFDPRDPARVQVVAADDTSGVAGVEIEARRRGDANWRSLDVESRGGRYTAVLDDDLLPSGMYGLRARVVDRAGNERTATSWPDGRPLDVALPIRAATVLQAGRPGRGRALVRRPRVGFGRAVSLQGRLRDAAGKPRGNAPVEVYERVDLPGRSWRQLRTVRTTAAGTFTFRAPAGPARVLRFRYPGNATTRPSAADVALRVRAGVTIVPSRRRVSNGGETVFRGRLLGAPIPEAGKLLALQARTARGWLTFATPRARGRDGRWAYRYRFTGTSSTTRYEFRVLVPVEESYPYAQGASRIARVLVFGER